MGVEVDISYVWASIVSPIHSYVRSEERGLAKTRPWAVRGEPNYTLRWCKQHRLLLGVRLKIERGLPIKTSPTGPTTIIIISIGQKCFPVCIGVDPEIRNFGLGGCTFHPPYVVTPRLNKVSIARSTAEVTHEKT
jgi:hypothetical protein